MYTFEENFKFLSFKKKLEERWYRSSWICLNVEKKLFHIKESHTDLRWNVSREKWRYVGGPLVGTDKQGILYLGIVSFIIIGLKSSVPYVIRAIPDYKLIATEWHQENSCKSTILLSCVKEVLIFAPLRLRAATFSGRCTSDLCIHKEIDCYVGIFGYISICKVNISINVPNVTIPFLHYYNYIIISILLF